VPYGFIRQLCAAGKDSIQCRCAAQVVNCGIDAGQLKARLMLSDKDGLYWYVVYIWQPIQSCLGSLDLASMLKAGHL
jgi:hypothetical protein